MAAADGVDSGKHIGSPACDAGGWAVRVGRNGGQLQGQWRNAQLAAG